MEYRPADRILLHTPEIEISNNNHSSYFLDGGFLTRDLEVAIGESGILHIRFLAESYYPEIEENMIREISYYGDYTVFWKDKVLDNDNL
jgi:hypothetical protein